MMMMMKRLWLSIEQYAVIDCKWQVPNHYCIFTAEYASEITVKFSQYVMKLWQKLGGLFLDHPVYNAYHRRMCMDTVSVEQSRFVLCIRDETARSTRKTDP